MALARIGALLLAIPPAGRAAPIDLPLDPAHASIGFRAYALGLFPLDGGFARFQGKLTIDPVHPAVCQVTVAVDIASLTMAESAVRENTLSPDLLDAPHYPAMRFDGACDGQSIAGRLTLHGQTHPLSLAVSRDGPGYVAEATLRRADWGIVGRPLLAGPQIRIRVSTRLPP